MMGDDHAADAPAVGSSRSAWSFDEDAWVREDVARRATPEYQQREKEREERGRAKLAADLAEREAATDLCWLCGLPWWRTKRRSFDYLAYGPCQACYVRRLRTAEMMGGYAGKAAARWKKGHPEMVDTISTSIIAQNPERAGIELRARWPKDLADPTAARQFIEIALTYGLDPFFGDVVPFQGRPYVTRSGWERLVQERAPGQLTRCETRLGKPEEYQERRLDSERDWLAFCVVERTYPEGRTVTFVDESTITGKELATANAFTPMAREPQRHVQGRAKTRALREAFRDVCSAVPLDTYDEISIEVEPPPGVDPGTGEIIEPPRATSLPPPQPPSAPEEGDNRKALLAEAMTQAGVDDPTLEGYLRSAGGVFQGHPTMAMVAKIIAVKGWDFDTLVAAARAWKEEQPFE